MIRQCVRPLRCFTTLTEARAVADTLPLPDHLPLLSTIPEGVLEGVPPDKHSSALQILAMQRPDAWKQLDLVDLMLQVIQQHAQVCGIRQVGRAKVEDRCH